MAPPLFRLLNLLQITGNNTEKTQYYGVYAYTAYMYSIQCIYELLYAHTRAHTRISSAVFSLLPLRLILLSRAKCVLDLPCKYCIKAYLYLRASLYEIVNIVYVYTYTHIYTVQCTVYIVQCTYIHTYTHTHTHTHTHINT